MSICGFGFWHAFFAIRIRGGLCAASTGLKKSANSTVYFASIGAEKALATDGEFRDLWVEFRYVRTERIFPSTQRRILVTEHASVFRNPIEMAVETMESKNTELEFKIAAMETLPDGGT